MIPLVLEDADGSLRFLVHPEWRRIVELKDLDYFESLPRDFIQSAQLHPQDLFKQISSLSVGPLLTRARGKDISDHPDLLIHCSGFVEGRGRLDVFRVMVCGRDSNVRLARPSHPVLSPRL